MASILSSSRGGRAPRRGQSRGGKASSFTKSRGPTKLDLEQRPLGHLVEEIGSSDLSLHADYQVTIHDCQYIASYNWLGDHVPTIVVPGKPPQWTPLKSPRRLNQDRGQYFRDPNAAKYPEYPMAPVVHAITAADSKSKAARTDLFACGSTFGNLLRFARGIDKAFRFDVEVVGETVFLIRKENDPKEIIEDVRGFGHTFPEAYTTWEHSVKGSETHQRIIRYNFAGFNCLVRFESDGYIRETVTDITPPQAPGDHDDLTKAFQKANIFQSTSTSSKNSGTIKVNHGGLVVPQQCIFDLKTRSGRYKREIDMSDVYPALWIKQIPNFIVAYHDGNGLFEDIQVKNVEDDVKTWAKDNRDSIRRLADLLDKIIDIARSDPGRLLEVYCPGSDRLDIRMQHGEGARALPEDLVARWVEMQRDDDDDDDDDSSAEDDTSGGFELGQDVGEFDEKWDDDSDSHFGSSEPDYTACSAHDCGYCGKCTY